MNTHTVNSFNELLETFENTITGQNLIYRGVSNSSYELVTSLGRCEPLLGKTIFQLERRITKLFKESSRPYLEQAPQNELEWLAMAQHFGLPTRLLDWSYNPLIATYFAVETNEDKEAAIYVFSGASTIQVPEKWKPTTLKKVQRYRPPYITSRIQNQAGLFTVHHNPEEPFTHEKLHKIIIPKTIKRKIKKSLYKYGINQKLIYPGLEGISKDLKWLETKIY